MEKQKTGFEMPQAGFEMPLTAKDEYAVNLWLKNGLGEHPSFREMEPIAKPLLQNDDTLLEGVAMVLGRRVDTQERNITAPILFTDPKKRFAILLLQYEIEKMENKKERRCGECH